jgi:DNA polymerase I-like protein with 3'-5' exonuclease and polymerase domains
LPSEIAQVRITVHDSIVANVREGHVDEISTQMKAALEVAAKDSIGWDFPFKAEISTGPTWGDLVESE